MGYCALSFVICWTNWHALPHKRTWIIITPTEREWGLVDAQRWPWHIITRSCGVRKRKLSATTAAVRCVRPARVLLSRALPPHDRRKAADPKCPFVHFVGLHTYPSLFTKLELEQASRTSRFLSSPPTLALRPPLFSSCLSFSLLCGPSKRSGVPLWVMAFSTMIMRSPPRLARETSMTSIPTRMMARVVPIPRPLKTQCL